jgi:hypothetical protein
MTRLFHLLESIQPMPDHLIEQQPVSVWREVEQMIPQGWQFNAKSAHELTHLPDPAPHTPGWLRIGHIETLNALDVPVSRMFTLAAIRERGSG